MKIELLLLGKTKDAYLQQGIDEYAKRLSRYASIELIEIKSPRHGSRSATEIVLQESALLEKKISRGACRIVLDSCGRQYSSEGFAAFVSGLEDRAVATVCFIIGGPLGLADEQREKADHVLSFSAMTFTHDMSRLILLEQLYRAYTIKAGTGYHK